MPIAAGIHYQVYQPNEPLTLVLLHGAGGSYLSWPAEIRHLKGYRTFALDLPGHGKSRQPACQSIDTYTERLLDWIEELALPPSVFAGHSMGGAIVQRLTLEHAERVLGLVLLGSASRLPVHPMLIQLSAQADTYPQAIEKIVSWSFSKQTSKNLKALIARRMAELPYNVLNGDLQACDAFDVTNRLEQIGRPTLVVCGAEDRMTPPNRSRHLAAHIHGAHLEIIPEAGHMVMIEKPSEIAGALERFLAGFAY